MVLQVTALYAGLLGLIGIVLSGLVGRTRGKINVSLGDSGNKALIEADRRHMNWVENVPFILVLFAIIELNGGSRAWLHVLGSTLLVARLVHPFGLDAAKMMTIPRFIGAAATMLVALAATLTVLWQYFTRTV